MHIGFPIRRRDGFLFCTFAVVFFAVQDVGAGYLVVTATHQCEFNLILDILYMKGAAARHPSGQAVNDLRGQHFDRIMDTTAGRRVPTFHREKRLGNGYLDLVTVKGCDLAVTANDTNVSRCHGVDLRRWDGSR